MNRKFGARGLATAALVMSTVGMVSTSVLGTGSASASIGARAASSTLVIGSVNSVQKLDPDVVTNFLDFEALGLIYNTLVQENSNLQITPDLATSWAFSNGNKTLTLNLRQGVKFDDGSTMTSADVVASLQRAQATKTADPSASFIGSVTSITASGPNTVVLKMSHPDVSVLEGLATVNLAIMPKAAITSGSIVKTPDGTGPFEYSSWVPSTSFTIKANPNYWGGKVALSSVEIKTIASEASISAALQAGTVQIALLSQPTVVATIPQSFTFQHVMDLSYRALQLQDKKGVFKNVNARLAMACAINRQQILDEAAYGDGKVVGPVPLGPYATNPVSAVCPTPNLAKARSYLKKAGMASGFSFTAITSDALDSTSAAQSLAMQSQLARVGIKMNIQNLQANAYIQDWLKGDFQAAFAWNGADPDPYIMYGRYFGAKADLAVPAGYSSSTLQSELLAGDVNSTAAGQKADWTKLSNTLTSQAVWLWLFDSYDFAVMSPKVQGFTLSPVNTTQLASLAKTTLK